jgi:exodeoxyribonuclease VII large subunit
MNALPPELPQPDVLIVARGGGSLEDLMAFNDEAVVRAAAVSRIPLISAVGHETDTTLIDFAADRRAPTPTAAAEMAVPARLELLADLSQRAARLEGALARLLSLARARLDRASASLPDLPALLNTARQRLDDRAERLALALPNFFATRRARVERLALRDPREFLLRLRGNVQLLERRLRDGLPNLLRAAQKRLDAAGYRLSHPGNEISARRAKLALLAQRLEAPLPARLREARLRLENIAARLEAVSYARVLARGFVLVTDKNGAMVTSAAKVMPGDALNLRFADGEVAARAEKPRARTSQLDLGF